MSVKPVLSAPPFKRSIHSQTVCALADLAVLARPPNSSPVAICYEMIRNLGTLSHFNGITAKLLNVFCDALYTRELFNLK